MSLLEKSIVLSLSMILSVFLNCSVCFSRDIDQFLICNGTYNKSDTIEDVWELYLYVDGQWDFPLALRRKLAGKWTNTGVVFRIEQRGDHWNLEGFNSIGRLDITTGKMEFEFNDPDATGPYRAICHVAKHSAGYP